MPRSISFFLVAIAAIIISSCTKEKINPCLDSSSGSLTIVVKLQHHEHTIVNLKNYRDTLYVKYNAQDSPGPDISKYDATIIGGYPDERVRITGVGCGNFFIYAVGLESIHSVRVSGGIPFSTDQREGEIEITIPVSE